MGLSDSGGWTSHRAKESLLLPPPPLSPSLSSAPGSLRGRAARWLQGPGAPRGLLRPSPWLPLRRAPMVQDCRLARLEPTGWPSPLGKGGGGPPGRPGLPKETRRNPPALGYGGGQRTGCCALEGFDATLGFPGEGPQLPRTTPSLKTETLTLVTANVTSWSTGTDAGVLSSAAEVFILQEVRMKDDPLRAAKAEIRRHKYHGQWAAARRIGPCGPAFGGLATLVCESRAFRSVAPERPGPNWSGGALDPHCHGRRRRPGARHKCLRLALWRPGPLEEPECPLEEDVLPRCRPRRRPLGDGG